MQMKLGFVTFWNCVATPDMQPVIFLSLSIETLMMLFYHNGHRTSRSFAAVSKITAEVCLLYTGMLRRCTMTMPCLFRFRRMRMSRYDVLMCVDMSKATKNFHASSIIS